MMNSMKGIIALSTKSVAIFTRVVLCERRQLSKETSRWYLIGISFKHLYKPDAYTKTLLT